MILQDIIFPEDHDRIAHALDRLRDLMFELRPPNLGDDLEKALTRVRFAGGEVLPDREDADYGRFGWFVDPDGNKVELWQPPEGQ